MKPNRRKFIQKSAAVLAGTTLVSNFPQITIAKNWKVAPSDQLNVALIGAKGRGFRVLEQHLGLPEVNCVGICDVDDNVLRERKATLEGKHGQKVKEYTDFRQMLENKDIDAVIIGTPDHWHCLPTVYACQAGKDVYVEKPMANSIAECNVMVDAARQYKRVVQVGQQQRSGKIWNDVMDYLKAGKLGKLRKANIWANFNYGIGPEKKPDTPVPSGVDYDFWLGPAPKKPFNPARFHGSWRFFWDYGGGLMTDWGVHLIDMALWAKEITSPPKVTLAYGNNSSNFDHARETFDTMSVTYPMDDYIINWEHTAGTQNGPYDRLYGIAFTGDDGTLVVDRNGWEVFPEWDGANEAPRIQKVELQKGNPGHDFHIRDFVKSVKERTAPACPPEIGRAVALAAHFANIAVRTGAYKLEWDDDKNKFTNVKEANQLIEPAYRTPWQLPNV